MAGTIVHVSYAADCAPQAVDIAHRVGGGTSNFEKGVLQRCMRDMHAVTQHFIGHRRTTRR